MSPVEQQRADKLLSLAREHFDENLRSTEERILVHSCGFEDPLDFTAPRKDSGAGITTSELGQEISPTGRPYPGWKGGEVRAGLVRWLLTDADAIVLLDRRGLRIWNAEITGPLDLSGCHIPVGLELRYCLMKRPIRLVATELPTLSIRNSTLENVLRGWYLSLNGPLLFEDVHVSGAIQLHGANVQGDARFSNLTLTAKGDALSMNGISISNNLLLFPGLRSSGLISARGGRVGGMVNLEGAKLTATGKALDLENTTISGSVYLRDNFECAGEINMIGAEIGSQLGCNKAKLTTTGIALWLDSARIRGNVHLREGFESAGEIRMLDAEIGGSLECDGAKFTSGACALWLERTKIKGAVFFRRGFLAIGEIRMTGADVGSSIECMTASIRALTCRNLEAKGDLIWKEISHPDGVSLDLRGAKIKAISDDRQSWPEPGNLRVQNLLVEDLRPMGAQDLRTTGRIAWLNLQPESDIAEPQPWMNLARILEDKGHRRDAKRAVCELRKHQSAANWRNSSFKWLGQRLDRTFARLEEQPLRILRSITILAVLCGCFFFRYQADFAPTNEAAYAAATKPRVQLAYPRFQPFVYALENELPVVKLGQDDHWGPDPGIRSHGLYWSLMLMRWSLIAAGYIQGGFLAAAVSARFRS